MIFPLRTLPVLRLIVVAAALGGGAMALMPRPGGQMGVADADGPAIRYRLTFPAPAHRWMQVEVTAAGVPPAPLSMRMSTASPGRYARHAFAKNVFDVQAYDGAGNALVPIRSAMARWDVEGHDGTVRFTYRVYGDRVDGTYLAIDETHAHVNMPAAVMWANGLEHRSATIRFEPPASSGWRIATQLFPTEDPLTFTAPNLQYLLDSPSELSRFAERSFSVVDPSDSTHRPTFRIALHHDGGDQELNGYAADVERIVREMVAVFHEFPRFETGRYTFIADYLPTASGDAMEHRNSTVLSSSGSLRGQHRFLLGSVSHEFFHVWNVERIRPRSLEPFDFETVNPSSELWLAEGVTNYYGALTLQRAGLATLSDTLDRFARAINTVRLGPGRRFRSAADMGRLAPYTDAAVAIDRTNWDNFFISYYTWGEALGLGLDLLVRARSAARPATPPVTLDDYMRVMWDRFGRPGGVVPGTVDRPYTQVDAQEALADLTGDAEFAETFFARFVEGTEVIDYVPLFARAGLRLRPRTPDRMWLGGPVLRFERDGARIVAPVPFGSPLSEAGIARDDVLVSLDNRAISSRGRLEALLRELQGQDRVMLEYVRRGELRQAPLVVEADPTLELVSLEQLGERPTPDQRQFRDNWLGSQIEN